MPGARSFDYVIVGAGSAGCVLANRLSADPERSVFLIEAGGKDRYPLFRLPMLMGRLFHSGIYNWRYHTEPVPSLGGRALYWPRGKVLGGSSTINGMIYVRGNRHDYDRWAQMGLAGWSYDDVLLAFCRSEGHVERDGAYHGTGGELTVCRARSSNPLFGAFVEAGRQAGWPVNDDFNGAEQQGFGRYDFTIRRGRRCSTSAAFLRPVRHRRNLAIATECLVRRVVLDGARASGVEVVRGGDTRTVRAEREVIPLRHRGGGPRHDRSVGVSLRLGAVLRTIAFIALALALCGVIFELAGYSALLMFEAIVEGAFLRAGGWAQSLRWALPLFITATGVAISFRCGFFNIGAQGQFYIGAISAAFVADLLGSAPAAVVLPASFLAGMAGGALWALWPGYLRLRSGTDEVITTLMGNFIATLVLIYVTSGPLKDPSGTGQQAASPLLPALYRISDSQGISPTIIGIAAAVALAMWVLVNRTPFGMLASLAGRNPTMVRFQGARLWTLGLSSFLISGALAGLAGTVELLGPTGRIASGFLPGHGFTAVLIALVANLSVFATAVVSLFFGGLASAALYLPILAGLPAAAIDIFNAAVALFITAKSGLLDRLLRMAKLPT